MFPFGFFEAYGAILMVEKYFQSKQLKTWVGKARRVTPRAEMKFHTQLKAAEEYSTVLSSDDAAFVARITHLVKQ